MGRRRRRGVTMGRREEAFDMAVDERKATGWIWVLYFTAAILFMLGAFQALIGLAAILNDAAFAYDQAGMPVSVDLSAWGWIHLILGVLALAACVGIARGKMWARVIAVGVAVLSAIANLLFLPANPFGSAILIGLDVLVIYAVTVHGGELAYV
jgi:hypothetical protein